MLPWGHAPSILTLSEFPGHEAMVPHLTTPDKVESICEDEPKLCRELKI